MSTAMGTCRECDQEFTYEIPDDVRAARYLHRHLCVRCDEALEAKRAAEAASEEAEMARDAARRAFAALNIPKRYRQATFENFDARTPQQKRALECCRDHAMDGVFLYGRSGCGKTHLACAAIKAAPQGGLFVGMAELIDDLKAGFDGSGRGLFGRALQAPLLAVDDFGAEAMTDFVNGRIYTLLNERWNLGQPLIITTNCSPQEIGGRVGEGCHSRIAGLCMRRTEVIGEDMRFGQPHQTDRRDGRRILPHSDDDIQL
jgi:DNA replication protein DnaC